MTKPSPSPPAVADTLPLASFTSTVHPRSTSAPLSIILLLARSTLRMAVSLGFSAPSSQRFMALTSTLKSRGEVHLLRIAPLTSPVRVAFAHRRGRADERRRSVVFPGRRACPRGPRPVRRLPPPEAPGADRSTAAAGAGPCPPGDWRDRSRSVDPRAQTG